MSNVYGQYASPDKIIMRTPLSRAPGFNEPLDFRPNKSYLYFYICVFEPCICAYTSKYNVFPRKHVIFFNINSGFFDTRLNILDGRNTMVQNGHLWVGLGI